MAPEQATHNETSPRSDLFSLGVMLHEIIAGQRPFVGASEFAIMQSVVNDGPRWSGSFAPTCRRIWTVY